jgi:hypothetical protein
MASTKRGPAGKLTNASGRMMDKGEMMMEEEKMMK